MDQDSFRSLLNASKAPSGGNVAKSKAYNRGSLLASGSSNAKPSESPQTAFKPRKVKKAADPKYRDRASERRDGVNDYAAVEGILQDFEKRMEGEDKQVVEEQRKYLGGDATHTVLVKGLDFALLEQTRARQEAREDLDDDLESAFQDKAPGNPAPSSDPAPAQGKKRTRAELLAELQRSREADLSPEAQQTLRASTRQEEIDALERAKQAGKFKPMGSSSFAPVEKKKKKKKKVVVGGQEKPKESATKVVTSATAVSDKQGSTPGETSIQPSPSAKAVTAEPLVPNPTPMSAPAQPDEDIEDADPFADAGEYEPDFGDDSDAEGNDKPKPDSSLAPGPQSVASGKRNWFNDPDSEPEPASAPTKPPTPPLDTSKSAQDAEPSHPTRLEGFASSAMPSVSEFLAMDKAEEEREKKRARKEKKKKAA